jgi:hypothetical protein
MTNTKTLKGRRSKLKKLDRRMRSLLSDKRAISVTLSTLILTAGVIAAGIAILYWAYSWGNVANDQYSSTVTNNQNAILESLSFEYITYSSTNSRLTVYVINCGLSNSLNLTRLYIWNSANQPLGTYTIAQLYRTSDSANISSLSRGAEGYFNVAFAASPLVSGFYTIRVVTGSGRNYDGSFSF